MQIQDFWWHIILWMINLQITSYTEIFIYGNVFVKKITSIITANDEIFWRGRANGKLKKTLWIWVIPWMNTSRRFRQKIN